MPDLKSELIAHIRKMVGAKVSGVFDKKLAEPYFDGVKQERGKYSDRLKEFIRMAVEDALRALPEVVGEPKVGMGEATPEQEAAERLAGTYNPGVVTFKAELQLAKPAEFISIDFIIDKEK